MLVYYETGRRKPTKYSKLVGLKAVIRIVESRRGIRLFGGEGGGETSPQCVSGQQGIVLLLAPR